MNKNENENPVWLKESAIFIDFRAFIFVVYVLTVRCNDDDGREMQAKKDIIVSLHFNNYLKLSTKQMQHTFCRIFFLFIYKWRNQLLQFTNNNTILASNN